jgi:hypothetical protein
MLHGHEGWAVPAMATASSSSRCAPDVSVQTSPRVTTYIRYMIMNYGWRIWNQNVSYKLVEVAESQMKFQTNI